MNIAITGSAGFVGSHLCRELAATPHTLTLASREDVAAEDSFQRLGSPELLIHLAWGALDNFQLPAHMTDELPLHFNFLRRMIVSGTRRVLAVGTCFEYGLQNGELDEETPCRPATWYGLAKFALLRQLELLQARHPFELLWPRLFYTYGEGQAPNAIYPQLLRAIADGQREFRMSAGEQLRDYLPVTEIARLLARLALSPCAGVVNICSGKPISLRRQVEAWIASRHADIQLKLGCYPYRDFEPMAFWGSRRRLENYLAL